jgi:glycosyltransferase involved in cell wall biosynthesis
MAADTPVLFLEAPVFIDDVAEPALALSTPHPNVYRAVPRLPTAYRDDYDGAIAQVRSITLAELRKGGRLAGTFHDPVQWFYTPMPAPAMLGAFQEACVVYDCTDELSVCTDVHPDAARRERVLLEHTDVVFTNAYSLAQSKLRTHHNVHFVGCGVDAGHFAAARTSRTPVARDVAHVPGPIAGYCGVVDERLDYTLIAALAASDPSLHVVMVGPVARVDPALLPQAPNIHWVGERAYEELPNYIKAFDVCLMPFALNETTDHVNPAKALEYMAAGKPIVSTAVADVVRNFTPVVNVALTPEEFVESVATDALHPDADYIAEGIAMAEAARWESVIDHMRSLMTAALAERHHVRAVRPELVIGLRAGISRASA